jgi:hypothetical protein
VQPISNPKSKKAKRKMLESAGWKIGTVSEFLALTPEESVLIEVEKTTKPNVPESSKSLAEALAGAPEEIKTIRDKTPIKPMRLH